mgnify:FL=1
MNIKALTEEQFLLHLAKLVTDEASKQQVARIKPLVIAYAAMGELAETGADAKAAEFLGSAMNVVIAQIKDQEVPESVAVAVILLKEYFTHKGDFRAAHQCLRGAIEENLP